MIYITYDNYKRPNLCGVRKKIEAQIEAFEKRYEDVYYTGFEYGIVYLYKKGVILNKKNVISRAAAFDQFLEWINEYNQDKVFFRFVFPVSWYMISFFEKLKYTGIKIILEMPTYPYRGMIQNPRVLLEDDIFNKYMQGLVSLTTTYSDDIKVFDNNTIALSNGVALERNPRRSAKKKNKTINLLAVSSMSDNQGYERIFMGLREYLAKEEREYEIHCHLVGTGRNLTVYKNDIEELGLHKWVEFHGVLQGQELDNIYQRADIGIGALAWYKHGIDNGTSMKLREYCVRGLPFIYAYDDMAFTGKEEYVEKVSNTPDPVNFDCIINLYERSVGREDIIEAMRSKAEREFVWEHILEPVYEMFGV